MTGLEERILVIIVDTAELDSTKVLLEILFTHEECTIIFI